jgi:hypothetical protein
MSNTKQVAKQTVTIKENDLIKLIDDIVNESVAVEKKKWITEEAKKNTDKTSVLEGKISALEAKFNKLTEGKK